MQVAEALPTHAGSLPTLPTCCDGQVLKQHVSACDHDALPRAQKDGATHHSDARGFNAHVT
jgi:hypothetical protein